VTSAELAWLLDVEGLIEHANRPAEHFHTWPDPFVVDRMVISLYDQDGREAQRFYCDIKEVDVPGRPRADRDLAEIVAGLRVGLGRPGGRRARARAAAGWPAGRRHPAEIGHPLSLAERQRVFTEFERVRDGHRARAAAELPEPILARLAVSLPVRPGKVCPYW
jgi:hypothetical protein